MLEYLLKHKLSIVGLLGGALVGYIYFWTLNPANACDGAACFLKSTWYGNTLLGAWIGIAVLGLFEKSNKKTPLKH